MSPDVCRPGGEPAGSGAVCEGAPSESALMASGESGGLNERKWPWRDPVQAALALVAVAVVLTLLRASQPLFAEHEPLLPLIVPVIGAALFGGAVAGLTATAAGAVAGNYLFIAPMHSLLAEGAAADRADLVLFVLVGTGISVLGERSNRRLREARHLHERLQQESRRLAQVVATAPGVVCAFQQRTDGSFSFPYASPGIEAIYDTTADALSRDASPIFRQMHPDDAPRVQYGIADSARTMAEWRDEFRIRRADGAERWIEGHSVPARQTDGSIIWYGFISDVTNRKQAEGTAQLWQRVFAQAGIGIAAADPVTNTWIAVNDTYARMRGYLPSELIGQPVATAYTDECKEEATARVREAERTGHATYEATFLRKDGSAFPAVVDLTVVEDAAGRPSARVGFILDLTARKRAEEAARVWQRAFEQSELSIAMSNSEGAFTAVNQAFARARGYATQELIGRPLLTIFPQESRAPFAAYVQTAGDHWVLETVHERKDGSRFPVLLDVTVVRDDAGQRTSRVAFVQDLTARRDAEAALSESEQRLRELNAVLETRVQERTRQLESANRELEAFSYSVSHDLRAPLRGIDGWSLALLEDFGDRLDTQARGHLDRVRAETGRMGQLIDDLLELSRVARAPLRREPIDLSVLAEGVAKRLRELHPDRALDLRIETGMRAEADRRLMDVVLANLLENAVKFTRNRSLALVEVGTVRNDEGATFFVRDNGVGFDMTYASALFGPFKRLHKASEFPGTGVGLATVQRIISRHGGRIWATAAVGDGATFFFTLG